MTQKKTPYKNVSGLPADLHDGRQLDPGKERSLTAEEAALPHNQQLITDGVLIEAEHAHHKTSTKKESD